MFVLLTLTFNISVGLFFKLRFVNFSINEYCIVLYLIFFQSRSSAAAASTQVRGRYHPVRGFTTQLQ